MKDASRRQPVGNFDAKMPKRQPVIAGEREIAQSGEGEREHDLIAARSGDRRPELVRIDVESVRTKIVSAPAMMRTLAAMPSRRSAER